MKERTEQEELALEICNYLRDIHRRLMDTNELYVTDLGKIQRLFCLLASLFNFDISGYVDSKGEVFTGNWGNYVFDDDPQSYQNMKLELDKEKD